MRNPTMASAVAIVAVVGFLVFRPAIAPSSQQGEPVGDALVDITLPESLTQKARIGKTVFEANCAACHGMNAVGRDGKGPPLVHKIYEPSHHGDESFQRAVALGVRAHHWRFGDMAPVDGLARADVEMIIEYVRELQRANGIN